MVLCTRVRMVRVWCFVCGGHCRWRMLRNVASCTLERGRARMHTDRQDGSKGEMERCDGEMRAPLASIDGSMRCSDASKMDITDRCEQRRRRHLAMREYAIEYEALQSDTHTATPVYQNMHARARAHGTVNDIILHWQQCGERETKAGKGESGGRGGRERRPAEASAWARGRHRRASGRRHRA